VRFKRRQLIGHKGFTCTTTYPEPSESGSCSAAPSRSLSKKDDQFISYPCNSSSYSRVSRNHNAPDIEFRDRR
jgi:hypothetical protein